MPGATVVTSTNESGRGGSFCCAPADAANEATTTARIAVRIMRLSSRPSGRSAIQPRHRADRRASATLDLDREADELETALAHELVKVHQALHVREAHVTAH